MTKKYGIRVKTTASRYMEVVAETRVDALKEAMKNLNKGEEIKSCVGKAID